MATTVINGQTVIYAPILKGQEDLENPLDPEQVADLVAAGGEGAEFTDEYIMSHGGAWRDPFTGERIGGVQDFFGITTAYGAGLSPEMAARFDDGVPVDPETGEPRNPMATASIESKASQIDLTHPVTGPGARQKLIDDAARALIGGTFTPDRAAATAGWDEQYGEGYLENIGAEARTRGVDILTGGSIGYQGESTVPVPTGGARTEVSRVENPDGTTTITYSDGTTEILPAVEGDDIPSGTELRSATDIVRNVLEDYGLGELLDDPDLDLINLWLTAGGDAAGAAAVWARVRQSDPYKDRFPGMAALSEAGRAVSEATYIELERGYIEIMNAAGIDPGFYDEPSDFGALIGGDVSVNEFNQRVALAVEATTRMTSEVREQLATYYPEVTDGDLTAYYLDPERATNIFEEREKIGAARIGGIAVETGFGSVSRQTAERLRAAGVTETAARRGFQTIAPSTLAEETASERLNVDPATGRPGVATVRVDGQVGTFDADWSGDITRGELVGAEFGTDPQAARRIEARRQRRLADFAQRGGPAMTGGGYTGLGTAT